MTEKKKTTNVISITKAQKSFQDLAEKTWNVAINSLHLTRKNMLAFAGAMKLIRDKELFTHRSYDNFEQACCSPELSISPKTVNNYIAIYEYWIEKQKIKMDELAGIEYNKLLLLKKVKKPIEFFEEAKTLAYKDFKKVILEKEFKLEPDESSEINNYIKKNSPCPFWTGESCTQGVPMEPKGPDGKKAGKKSGKKKKDDGLI